MIRKNAMKVIFAFIQLWVLVISSIDVGNKNSYEDDHLASLLKQFMLMEITTENQSHITTPAIDIDRTSTILPYFDHDEGAVNITSQFGSTVIFHCRVSDLMDKMVSWVKRTGDKIHLISYGKQVYSSDQRYELMFREPNDWQLRIQFVNERDNGHYECQISTHPPIALTVFLIVIVPQLEISDERGVQIRNKFYNIGSTIELKCVVSKIPRSPNLNLLWKHGDRVLNYDTVRGGISVKTEILSDGAKSHLFVASVKPSDSGNYSCYLSDTANTVVQVQVLYGDIPAAMQHGGSRNSNSFRIILITLPLIRVLSISV